MGSRDIRALFIFVLFYATLYFLGLFVRSAKSDFPVSLISFDGFPWKSDYTLLLMPVVGFFFVYFLVPYLRKEFGFGKVFVNYVFPVLFLVGSYVAFYLAVYVYHYNNASLYGIEMSDYVVQTNLDFFRSFLSSSFFYFVLAGLAGWFAVLLIERFEGKEKV